MSDPLVSPPASPITLPRMEPTNAEQLTEPVLKKKPEKKAPPNVTEERFSKLENAVDKLTQVAEALLSKENASKAPEKTKTDLSMSPVEREQNEEDAKGRIIPLSWLAVLHKHLGKDFSYHLEEGGAGSYAIRIIFPAHIDRRVGTEKSIGGRDVSMASPLRMASPLADLEKWCTLIVQTIKRAAGHENFTPKN